MGALRDLTRTRFGRLTVLALEAIRDRHAYWRCRCDCGNTVEVRGSKLTAGKIVSCGCYRADPAIRQAARLQIPPAKRSALARIKH